MSGGATGTGYDLPASLDSSLHREWRRYSFDFWHNNFGGELMSHGCINAARMTLAGSSAGPTRR